MSSENTARRGQGKAVGFMAGGFAIYREHFSSVIIPWGGGLLLDRSGQRSGVASLRRGRHPLDLEHEPRCNHRVVNVGASRGRRHQREVIEIPAELLASNLSAYVRL
jgi:hypothetical protein